MILSIGAVVVRCSTEIRSDDEGNSLCDSFFLGDLPKELIASVANASRGSCNESCVLWVSNPPIYKSAAEVRPIEKLKS